jgi:hypothetical protein
VTAQYGTKNAISNCEVGLDYYFNTTNSEGIIEKIWILDYQMAKTFSELEKIKDNPVRYV